VLTACRPLWRLLFATEGTGFHGLLFAASLFLALLGLNMLLLRLLSPGRTLRWMLGVLLVLAAGASWFADTYGVVLDSEMLRNVAQTNPAEARDFIGMPLLVRLLWQAGLPIALISQARLPLRVWTRSLREYALGALGGAALLLVAALPMYSSYATFFRNQHAARYYIAPANVIVGSVRLARKTLHRPPAFSRVGEDAQRMRPEGAKPLVLVLVVGETARAANFSLGGYARDTNPLLRQKGVYYFTDVESCGTATATSLPCMFSELPREEFKLGPARYRDSVLDILQRAGVAVSWIDNQSGCKWVCDRVPSERASAYDIESCAAGECLDEALLRVMDRKLPQAARDGLITLHAMGSHGPAYYRRVPKERRVFEPVCDTERINTCSDEKIVNTYDNTIVYTDYILAGLIDRLAADQQRVDTVLLYVSDHGESLGESGLYLHGQPWMVAPRVQKQVPMLLWFSSGAPARLGLNTDCLRAELGSKASHDNLSHTMLGLFDVTTSVYRPALDLLRDCRRP